MTDRTKRLVAFLNEELDQERRQKRRASRKRDKIRMSSYDLIDSDLSKLTERERDVVDLLFLGMTHEAIAEELGVSVREARALEKSARRKV